MSKRNSQFIRNLRDMGSIEIISVIASFDTDGQIRPLYIRIGDDSLKVISSWEKPDYARRRTFQCKVIDQNIAKPARLTYYEDESVWVVHKGAYTFMSP